MSNLVILSRQCIYLTRNFPSLRQAVNVRRHILPCQNTRISDFTKRFKSVNVNNDPPLCDPKTDPDVKRKLEFFKLEMENLRHSGYGVPQIESIKQTQWDELLKCRTASARTKYYKYLFINEKKKENIKVSVTFAVKSLTIGLISVFF